MSNAGDGCVTPERGPISAPEMETVLCAPAQKEERKMPAQVGKPAPDFEANAFFEGGFRSVKLSDYEDHWVVVCFYPGDFTFVLPTELTAVAAKYDEIKALGVEILSISTNSHFVHKIWQEQELSKMVSGGVPYPMLSDSGGRIGRVYGVYDEEAGVDRRQRQELRQSANRLLETRTIAGGQYRSPVAVFVASCPARRG